MDLADAGTAFALGAGPGLTTTTAFEAAGVGFVLTARTLEGAVTCGAGTALAAGLTTDLGVFDWTAAFAGKARATALAFVLGKGFAGTALGGTLTAVLRLLTATGALTLAGALDLTGDLV